MTEKQRADGMQQKKAITYHSEKGFSSGMDFIAKEVPVALVYNGISHVVMMATPLDLKQFAIGFSLSEQIIESIDEIYGIDILSQSHGIEIHIELSSRRFIALKQKRRALVGRTGCGLCGTEHLADVWTDINTLPFSHSFSIAQLALAFDQLSVAQYLHKHTGSTHAAGWVSSQGCLLASYEDVGRHNALDKLLGYRAAQDCQQGVVLISSRASYEMVKKAAACGVQILFSVSGATSLSIDLAMKSNLTLVSFCRKKQAVIYSHPERIYSSYQLKQGS